MCLQTKEVQKPKIAEKDIVCYKRLSYLLLETRSEYNRYPYKKGLVQPHVKIKYYIDGYGCINYNQGYHSRVYDEIPYFPKDKNNAIFIIPKGTKYIIGSENSSNVQNYLSESIMYFGRNNWLGNLRLKSYLKKRNGNI